MKEKQIEAIRMKISEIRRADTNLPTTVRDLLSYRSQDAVEGLIESCQVYLLEWVLRDLFEVTP